MARVGPQGMTAFALLRGLAFLKRITLALEESNRLTRERMALENPSWARKNGMWQKPSRLVGITVPRVEDWNERDDEAEG